MTANPLRNAASAANFKSSIRASEWARMARDKGHLEAAKAWDEADRNGWDHLHFDENWDPIAKRLKAP